MPIETIAFYRFVVLSELETLRQTLRSWCEALGLRGTIVLAREGINATLAGSTPALDSFLACLHARPEFADLSVRRTASSSVPFRRMKIKLRQEIVTLGIEGIVPERRTGQHVSPGAWNELLKDRKVFVLDARNDYEFEIGTFDGAYNPRTENFREFPRFVENTLAVPRDQPIAMFCTGGIRCEKASTYLLEQGFNEVYQLAGGVLAYLETVAPENSLWHGDCFVFDERVAVTHRLQPADYLQCPGCRAPVSAADRQSKHYQAGICCRRCHHRLSDRQRRSFRERHKQVSLAAQSGRLHLGANND